jgi:hypothetical protein
VNQEVYCDESHPDAFSSRSTNRARFLMIGGLWLPHQKREEVKDAIRRIMHANEFGTEIKWHKAHTKYERLYTDLIDLFVDTHFLRFRCIAVDAWQVDHALHDNDHELGFYKFYYQLLTHWIEVGDEYRIVCDEKTNRVGDRLPTLQRVLNYTHQRYAVTSIQALPSKEVVLLQLADLLLGAASSAMNGGIKRGGEKSKLVDYLANRLGRRSLGPTARSDNKYNMFGIQLRGAQQ